MPPFSEHHPPTVYQLREWWRRYRNNGVVQRVILEIQHLRGFIREVESFRQVIQRCWYDETGNQLVALGHLRTELQGEIFRAGVTHGPSRPLPPFVAPTRHDLHGLEQHYPDDECIHTLIGELRHARAFILRIDELRSTTERCWRAETDCDLVALEELRLRLEREKARAGVIATAEPARREQSGLTARIALDFDGQSEMNRT